MRVQRISFASFLLSSAYGDSWFLCDAPLQPFDDQVESALALGSSDESVVRCELLTPKASAPVAALPLEELGRLSRYERPMPEMIGYDQLLAGAR